MEDISKSQIETGDFHLKHTSREDWNINFCILQVGIKILSYVFEVLKNHFFSRHDLSMARKQELRIQMGHPFNTFLD
jgi:hypothetical protein